MTSYDPVAIVVISPEPFQLPLYCRNSPTPWRLISPTWPSPTWRSPPTAMARVHGRTSKTMLCPQQLEGAELNWYDYRDSQPDSIREG